MATFNRKVFYLGGFDPRGVRYYHQLVHEQLARLSATTGATLSVSKRRRPAPHITDWTIDAPGARTDYSFLGWEDIVRARWIPGRVELARRAFRAYRDNIRHLDFRTGRRLGRGPLITLAYPPLFTIFLPLLLFAVFALAAALVVPWWAAIAVGVAAAALIAPARLQRLHAPWLLRFFVFNAELAGGAMDADLDTRLDMFADAIAQALAGDWDEVLLIAHSNGSIVSVPLLARLLPRFGGALPARFAFVTLGECIPLIACRRDAHRFHDQLRAIAAADFRWFDIGSPPDGAAYCLVDPMRIVAADPRPRLDMMSARFHLFYDAANYPTGYAGKYDLHFNYLRTGDRPSPIDLPSLLSAARPVEASVAAFRTIP